MGRFYAQRREEAGGNGNPKDALQLALQSDGDGLMGPCECCQLLEALAVLRPLLEFSISVEPGAACPVCGVALPDDREPLRISVRQRFQQNSVNDAEDGGVGADAESKREDSQGSEARRLAQHAEGEAEILEQRVEERKATALAIDLAGLLDTAEVEERLAPGLLAAHALSEVAFDGHV